MTTNELELARAFRETMGLDPPQAERLATTIFDAIHSNVATKMDIASVKADIAIVQSNLREAELRLEAKIDRMVSRLGALTVIVAGLLFAALQYWPRHP